MDIEAIRATWPAILERAREYLPALEPLLEGAVPARLDGSRLMIALPAERAVYATILASSGRLSVVARALEAETGQHFSVELESVQQAAPPPPPPETDVPMAGEPSQVIEPPVEGDDEPVVKAGRVAKPKKEKKARDPLADIRGEQIRYLLEFNPPAGESLDDLAPWWERKAKREALQQEFDERQIAEKAAAEPPVDDGRTEQSDLPLVQDVTDAIMSQEPSPE